MPNISRNLEQDSIYLNRFITGLVTQRTPLFTPLSSMGLQVISMRDVLADGLNTEISHVMSIQRRPAFTRFCSQQFSASDYPTAWFSFKKLDGTILPVVDTPTHVYSFSGTTLTPIYTKISAARMTFTSVADTLYMCNGADADAVKWDGTTVSKWGIAAPDTAPTIATATGTLSSTAGYTWGYSFKNSSTGHVSTMSPASGNVGQQSNKQFTVSGSRSTDVQVDKIVVFRTDDGGANYFFLAEIANPPSGTWSFTDNNPDSALNDFIEAPLAHLNDPPPSGINLSCKHLGYVCVATGNKVYIGGGALVTLGVAEEAFPPANVFAFPGKVTAMASTSIGLIVWTPDNTYLILGNGVPGVSGTSLFYPKLWQSNFGVQSQNCVQQDGDNVFVFTSRKQLFSLGSSLEEIGQTIRSQLAAFDPTKVSLALHRSGDDEGLFVSDGTANIFRYSIAFSSWSPKAQPVGGCGLIASIETTTSDYRLMVGRTAGSGYILSRDPTSFSDDGGAYPSWAVVGSLVVASPGQTALITSVFTELMPVGTYPTVSVLLNEVSGNFTALLGPVNDPPALSGAPSTTVLTKRHYLKGAQSPLPGMVRHMQVRIDFGSEAFKNELIGLGVA